MKRDADGHLAKNAAGHLTKGSLGACSDCTDSVPASFEITFSGIVLCECFSGYGGVDRKLVTAPYSNGVWTVDQSGDCNWRYVETISAINLNTYTSSDLSCIDLTGQSSYAGFWVHYTIDTSLNKIIVTMQYRATVLGGSRILIFHYEESYSPTTLCAGGVYSNQISVCGYQSMGVHGNQNCAGYDGQSTVVPKYC